MTPFEFVSVFFSVVLGLAVAHLMGAIGELVEVRHRVRTCWVNSVWVFAVFLIQISGWWGMWDLKRAPSWDLKSFLLVVMYLSGIYLLTTMVLPRVSDGEKPLNLKEHYESVRPTFFATLAALLLLAAFINVSLFKTNPLGMFMVMPVSLAAMSIVASRTSNKTWHGIFAVLFVSGLIVAMLSDTVVIT